MKQDLLTPNLYETENEGKGSLQRAMPCPKSAGTEQLEVRLEPSSPQILGYLRRQCFNGSVQILTEKSRVWELEGQQMLGKSFLLQVPTAS
jgi:hypothetical protein